MIFALHPIHVEPVVGVTFREDLLVTLFYLSAMLLYIKFREGSSHLSMGIKDKAMLAYRKTLKVNPGHSQATAAIGRMGGLDNR